MTVPTDKNAEIKTIKMRHIGKEPAKIGLNKTIHCNLYFAFYIAFHLRCRRRGNQRRRRISDRAGCRGTWWRCTGGCCHCTSTAGWTHTQPFGLAGSFLTIKNIIWCYNPYFMPTYSIFLNSYVHKVTNTSLSNELTNMDAFTCVNQINTSYLPSIKLTA